MLIIFFWYPYALVFLKKNFLENKLLSECRKVWVETHDPSKALDALKNYSCVERKLLEGLQRYSEKNHVAALSMVILLDMLNYNFRH